MAAVAADATVSGAARDTLDDAKLAARARAIGDAAARRALDAIGAAIAADYPALAIEREIATLRVSGAALRGLARRDVRLRLPGLWLDDWDIEGGGGR